jgi:diadenosine tetraphosphate (Ap4A) HIT family hydrolase
MRVIKKWLFGAEVDLENCIFCKFPQKKEEPFHFEDEKYYVITDIQKASAQEHLLVITKQHIDNALQVEDPEIIR